ncbi:MAG: SMC-Scp complex subunit ScpB [Firmicutes bacterium]|nr:SMC-Scp complex subunit ScpB [Bacillota bacterium]
MKLPNLPQIIESILYVAGEGVPLSEIADKLETDIKKVNEAISLLQSEKYNETSGVQIILYKNKAQFATNPVYAEEVAAVLNPIKERALTRAALETIAIIAYKQPVTRLEIEQIRGVNSDYAVQLLLSHRMIEVVGRKDVVGKPLLFGTTEEFLKRFQLQDIDNLPNYETLLESIKVLNIDRGDALYNEFEILPVEDIEAEALLVQSNVE